jgi:two-component system, NarL family, response regulator LiaR
VVLLEENEFLRTGLKAALAALGICVVGEAVDADALVQLAAQLSPAVVIVGMSSAGQTAGLEATKRVAAESPRSPVIIVADSARREDVTDAIRAGARGYMLKGAPKEAIAGAVQAVAAGDSVLSSKVAEHLLEGIRSGALANGRAPQAELKAKLTGRELDVLKLIGAGKENNEIACALSISPSTVRHHTSSILAKLGLENRIQAAVYAVRCGLI